MKTYYCTANWHDYPEGGTYGDLVQANSYEDAEKELRLLMAASHIDNYWVDEDFGIHGLDPEDEEAAIQMVMEMYAYEWVVVDCYPYVDNFINNLGDITDAERTQLRKALEITM